MYSIVTYYEGLRGMIWRRVFNSENFINKFKAVHAGIRIFDPMLFEDTVVSKIMEDFNTKCYVMNNKEKLFQ